MFTPSTSRWPRISGLAWGLVFTIFALHACAKKPVLPPTELSGFLVEGRTVSGTVKTPPNTPVSLKFSVGMLPSSVRLHLNDQPINGTWSPDTTTVTVQPSLLPYQQAVLQVLPGAKGRDGRGLTGTPSLTLSVLPEMPVNTTSGIRPGFSASTPVLVVIDNAPPTRPQSGLQRADIVFEYISEYSITRFTALFFNNPAPLIGPVRSCRMINLYLDWSFRAIHMCSGVSNGTKRWLLGHAGVPATLGFVNDFASGGHFFRVHSRVPPYNLFTDAAEVARARRQKHLGPLTYLIDSPHPDVIAGLPAAPPVVRKQGISYRYDPITQTYTRYEDGRIFKLADGKSVHVKNVVVMNVPSHDAGWVEDTNGGAHSVWYNLLGSGPAAIWSDGHLIRGMWHIGRAGISSSNYWMNDEPPWFTDLNGNVIKLNSGLTWIHVVGSWP